jgi:hypothetical protein
MVIGFTLSLYRVNKGVCQTVALAIYIQKYLKAKEEEELWKLKYFTIMQKHNLQNIL